METTSRRTDRHETGGLESDLATMHPLISWRSVVAGTLVAFFSMVGLIGLGLAFGGIGLDEGTSMRSAGIFTGVWFLVSALISVFLGSYFAARVSKFQTGRIGSAQGLVIAALFLGFFMYQGISAIGSAGSAAGSLLGQSASLLGQGAQKAAQNDTVMNTVNNITEDAMGDLNLRSDPGTVATGVVSRLARGNVESAQNYLGRQAGISPEEADQRINQIQTQMTQVLTDARQVAAQGLKSAGWSLFLMVVLGGLAAVGGGALGSKANFRKPLSREQYTLRHQHA